MIYFTSDLHFNHLKIIELSKRPFKDIGEMNETLIKNWNRTVKPNDEIYILGDMGGGDIKELIKIIKRLNGKKYLITGNHDRDLLKNKEFCELFKWIKDYYTFKYNKRKFVLFHYPIYEWDGFFKGAIHLYGHTHETLIMPIENAFNVGIDVNNYTPLFIDDILKKSVKKD